MTINEAIQTLGLEQPVTLVKIKHQFRAKARLYHPDATGESSHAEFIQIKEAYDTLKDKSEYELNNQIFKPRVDYSQPHKPAADRGMYIRRGEPDTILVQDAKNVIYFFFKYFRINWVDIFYHTYSQLGQAHKRKASFKYLQTFFLMLLIVAGLPIIFGFLFCGCIFYLLQMALIPNTEKFKHQSYYHIYRQVLIVIICVLFFYIMQLTMPLFLVVICWVFTLPALCLVQVSLLYSFLNRE